MTEDRFISPAGPATAREREITEIVVEECAEIVLCAEFIRQAPKVIQRGTKLLRFGPEEIQPGQPHSNAYRLGLEIGDLLEIVDMAVREGLVSQEAIDAGRANKKRQLAKFMQTRG